MSPTGCLDENLVVSVIQGTVAEPERASVHRHIDACASCRALLATLAVDEPAPPEHVVRPWAGRYQIESMRGRGGMGVVFRAWDIELERTVAIKVLRPDRVADAADMVARLRRESKAMARLRHPNVVAVHDVARHEDQLFLVMEYVDGSTLGEWVADPAVSWQDALRTYLAAAEGLSAAHAVGIVHRDFKPDNVLVDRDGRPVVTDFGLARVSVADADGAGDAVPSGRVVGTLRYLAPEELVRPEGSVQADVFAFCVSLYEALYRQRAFAGDDRSRVEVAPRSSPVPAWLFRALERGLSVDLDVRYRSMRELCAALAGPRRRARWPIAAAASAGIAVAVAATWALAPGEAAGRATCDPTHELAGAWDPLVRAGITAVMTTAPGTGAIQSWRRVDAALGQYGDQWAAAARGLCEAPPEPALAALRDRCLRASVTRLRVVTSLLAAGDAEAMRAADRAVAGLPAIADCAGADEAALAMPMPTDPPLRRLVDELRDDLGRADGLRLAAKHKDASAALDRLRERAAASGYPPIEAEVLLARALNLRGAASDPDGTHDALREAAAAAEASRHERLAVEAWLALAEHAAQHRGELERGREYARFAHAAIERIGGDRRLEATLAMTRGKVEWRDGKLDPALAEFRRAIELSDPDSAQRTEALHGLGLVYTDRGRYAEALEAHNRVLALRRRQYGDAHPSIASSHTTLGNLMMRMGRQEESLAHYREADRLAQQIYGPDHYLVQISAHNLGGILRDMGRPREAEIEFRRAVRIGEAAHGADHPHVAKSMQSLAMTLVDQGQAVEAVEMLRRAVAIKQAAYGDDHVETAGALADLGMALRVAGELPDAIAVGERAVAAHSRLDPQGVDLAAALFTYGRALAAARRTRDASRAFQRSLAIYDRSEAPGERAEQVRAELAALRPRS